MDDYKGEKDEDVKEDLNKRVKAKKVSASVRDEVFKRRGISKADE